MVKTPKTRHSKVHRNPVTIDLGPGEVSRIEEAKPAAEEGSTDVSEAASATVAPDTASATNVSDTPADVPFGSETTATSDKTQPEPLRGEALDDELASKIGSEPRYATEFGRDAGDGPGDAEPGDEPVAAWRGLLPGLAGGAIALLGAGVLQYAGVLPAPGNPEISGLRTEIGVIRQEIDGLKDNAGLADAEAVRKLTSESSARVDGLAESLDKMEANLAGLRASMSSGGGQDSAALQALDQKVRELDQTVSGLRNGGTTPELEAANQKIASLESALAAATAAGDSANRRLVMLEQQVTGLAGKVEEQASQPRAALAIAAAGLQSAIDRGGAFAAEVETFAAVAPDAPELPELRTLAAKGVPSRGDLVAATPAAATAMIEAAQVLDENAGVVDRLLASAKSLVKIRPAGPVEGTGVPETVSRLEAAVKDGNFAKALAEYDTLPEPVKAAGAGLADSLRERLKVEELVDKAQTSVLKPAGESQ